MGEAPEANTAATSFSLCAVDEKIAKFFANSFSGWHYSIARGRTTKTTLAVIAQPAKPNLSRSQVVRDLHEAISKDNVVDVNGTSGMDKLVACIHNDGNSLQVGAGSMEMTRPLRILVKGGNATDIGTVCVLRTHVVLTSAYDVASAFVACRIIEHATSCGGVPRPHKHSVGERIRKKMKDTPGRDLSTLRKVYECAEWTDSVTVASAVQTAAVLHTGYSDSGTTFRDRASRQQAGRMFAELIVRICNDAVQES